jgi:hypothetical protein
MEYIRAVEDYLLDLDLEQMCEEMGITQEDILRRFRDRLHQVYERLDRGYQRNLIYGYDELDEEDEENIRHFKRIANDEQDEEE